VGSLPAGASATVSLIWGSGQTQATIASSSSTVLNIILTNDVANIGGSVSVDYSEAAVEFDVIEIINNPHAGTLPYLPLTLGPTSDMGGTIESFNAAALPPYVGSGLPGGQSDLLGTIRFHKARFGNGMYHIFAYLGVNDSIAAGTGAGVLPPSQVTLGSVTAQLPEPATASLLALGLVGLAMASRRWNP